jgi:hypothetical protein
MEDSTQASKEGLVGGGGGQAVYGMVVIPAIW